MISTEKVQPVPSELEWGSLSRFIPEEVKSAFADDIQSAFPAIAKNAAHMDMIENAIQQIPTEHRFLRQDSTELRLPSESVHLVLTSHPIGL